MKEEELRKYNTIFNDIWNHFKKYSSPDRSESFWKLYAEDVKALDSKYEYSELFRNLVLAVTKEIMKTERER